MKASTARSVVQRVSPKDSEEKDSGEKERQLKEQQSTRGGSPLPSPIDLTAQDTLAL